MTHQPIWTCTSVCREERKSVGNQVTEGKERNSWLSPDSSFLRKEKREKSPGWDSVPDLGLRGWGLLEQGQGTVENDSLSFAVQGVSEQLTSASHPHQVDTLNRKNWHHSQTPPPPPESSSPQAASATAPLWISAFANCLLQEISFAIPEPLLSDCDLVHTGVFTGICAQTYTSYIHIIFPLGAAAEQTEKENWLPTSPLVRKCHLVSEIRQSLFLENELYLNI